MPRRCALVEAYGCWLSRNGKADEAVKMFQAFDTVLPRHPLIVEATEDAQAQ